MKNWKMIINSFRKLSRCFQTQGACDMSKSSKNPGETIVEILISTVILTMVLGSAFVILNQATSVNTGVKNRVIALNIAREGFEGVRSVRDTNWLKYSGDRRKKWLCKDSMDSDPDLNKCANIEVTSSDLITDGFYTIDFSPTHDRYFLVQESPGTEMNLYSEIKDFYHLYNDVDPESGRFTHEKETDIDSVSVDNIPSPFFRQIEVVVLNDDVCNANCNEQKIHVISRVQWLEDGTLRHSVLEGYLYDYLERDSY